MENGNKIILILGIAAAVIFAGTIFVSMANHYATKTYHQEKFDALCAVAEKGLSSAVIAEKLKENGYIQLSSRTKSDGGKILIYSWAERQMKDAGRFQQKRLGVPIAVELVFDAGDKLIYCNGLNDRKE